MELRELIGSLVYWDKYSGSGEKIDEKKAAREAGSLALKGRGVLRNQHVEVRFTSTETGEVTDFQVFGSKKYSYKIDGGIDALTIAVLEKYDIGINKDERIEGERKCSFNFTEQVKYSTLDVLDYLIARIMFAQFETDYRLKSLEQLSNEAESKTAEEKGLHKKGLEKLASHQGALRQEPVTSCIGRTARKRGQMPRKYSTKHYEQILQLRADGKKLAEIAGIMKIPIGSLGNLFVRAEEYEDKREEELARAAELAREVKGETLAQKIVRLKDRAGMTFKQVAQKFDMTVPTVSGIYYKQKEH